MQDIHSIGGGGPGAGNRLFATGGGIGAELVMGGDRRLRPHNHLHHHHNQALKCPRCDSLNTKFCYYNNYNLSQPRHFCKSCRRYWTKGGILRNVPVGGGCRKSKRSSSRQPKQPPPPTSTNTTTTQQDGEKDQQNSSTVAGNNSNSSSNTNTTNNNNNNNNSKSSSESSSLSVAATVAAAMTTNMATCNTANNTAVENDNNDCTGHSTVVLNGVGERKLFVHESNIISTNYDSVQPLLDQTGPGFFTEMGSFTSLIASVDDKLQFGFGAELLNAQQGFDQNHHHHHHHNQQLVDGGGVGVVGGLIDQTVHVEFSGFDHRSGCFGPLDWQGSDGAGFFDVPSAVDQAYWSQSQWSTNATTDDNQHQHSSLYLP